MPGVQPPAFAVRKKAACLERSSPPLPKARGRGARENQRRGRALSPRTSASVCSPLRGANCPGCNPRARAFTFR